MVALRIKSLVVAVIASFAAVGAVHSADLTVPPLAPVQDFSGWYLRGDTGPGTQQVGSPFAESRFESAQNKRFGAAPFFGFGTGDVSANREYRVGADFHGLNIGDVGGAFMPDRYTGSKYEWTFLFSGYPGLGTWWNFAPFLGAGTGGGGSDIAGHQAWPAAQLRWLRFTATAAAQG